MADFASTAARELAAQHDLDISVLTGTGRDGAITAADVRSALDGTDAADPDRPAPPPGLGDAGADLWRQIMDDGLAGDWALDGRELVDLERACTCADRLAQLDRIVREDGMTATGSKGQTVIHPALAEARQLELVQHRLLASLQLVNPASGVGSSPVTERKRRAARTRWDREAQKRNGLAVVQGGAG
jgi:pyruvate/2-oxoglutarate dehydrogenase complex dihydrolipoamide acyltransferase (E2) component